MLSVGIPSSVMLIVVVLSRISLSGFMPSVISLSVVLFKIILLSLTMDCLLSLVCYSESHYVKHH
jgi:hypothetical protein